jgi:metal-dependent HD superfamily phosphatase/phosphodiesterase
LAEKLVELLALDRSVIDQADGVDMEQSRHKHEYVKNNKTEHWWPAQPQAQ